MLLLICRHISSGSRRPPLLRCTWRETTKVRKQMGSPRSDHGNTDLSELRKPYAGDTCSLTEENLPSKNPFEFFEQWFQKTLKTPAIGEPNAMAVATCDKNGFPSVRMVLLKKYDSDGFCFYTNYGSRKGTEIQENNKAALLFFWEPLSRQIRIEGEVQKLPEQTAEEYFNRRPKNSQVSASISPQSQAVRRSYLQEKYDEEMKKYESIPVPKPNFWGGFRVIPKYFEFWQGTSNRLHDRIIFRRPEEGETPDEELLYTADDGWVFERLGP